MFDTGLDPMTSVVGGRRLDDWATEAHLTFIRVCLYGGGPTLLVELTLFAENPPLRQ